VVLLTDKACRFYDEKGEEKAVLEFGAEGISRYSMGDTYFLRQYPLSALSAATRLEAYRLSDGKRVFVKDYEQGLRLAKTEGEYLFTSFGNELVVTRPEEGDERTVTAEEEVTELLPIDEEKIVLLTDGTGNVLDYKGLFETKGESSEWEQ